MKSFVILYHTFTFQARRGFANLTNPLMTSFRTRQLKMIVKLPEATGLLGGDIEGNS